MIPIIIGIFALIEQQMLDQGLTIDPHAFLPRTADRLMRLLTGYMHNIERNPRHIGNHDSPVGGLTLDLRWAGIGMRLRAVIPLGHQLCLQLRDNIAIFGMNQRHRPQFRTALERGIHLVIIDHQRALIGHEMLEGVNALIDNNRHLIEHFLTPPGDRHMEGIISGRQ